MSGEVQRVQDMLASLLDRSSENAARLSLATPLNMPVRAVSVGTEAGSQPCRGTALLVDGRDDNLQFLAHELAPLGLEVQRVAGGSEALERLQQDVFEFVFLATGDSGIDAVDGMDGFHTCRLLQRMPPAQPVAPPPTLVLMLAGDTGVNRLRAERAGGRRLADTALVVRGAAEDRRRTRPLGAAERQTHGMRAIGACR